MATITRTLTINAAFLQEIKEDNHVLGQLLRVTRRLFSPPPVASPEGREACESLARLRDQLAVHFALENAYGYFEDAIAQAPRLSDQAEALRNQHNDLFAEICQLAERAEQLLEERRPMSEDEELVRNFCAFYDRFQDHENRENELIMAAFDDDIGVGD